MLKNYKLYVLLLMGIINISLLGFDGDGQNSQVIGTANGNNNDIRIRIAPMVKNFVAPVLKLEQLVVEKENCKENCDCENNTQRNSKDSIKKIIAFYFEKCNEALLG